MNIKEIKSDKIDQKYYVIDHPTGLKIFVYPKEGFGSSCAMFGTKYGSINNAFSVDGKEVVKVPDGIAHFLEHKLFESDEGDAFTRYAKTGANANAFTTFDRTCYYFTCSENFKESLEILLDFVTSPYFTEQTVKKELGIIGQEIKMYDDSPEWCVLFNMLSKMYYNHPVKIDIAGTVDSIAKITPEYLYSCYNAYYNLSNMVLSVAGNVDVDEVLEVADKVLKKGDLHTINNHFENEPDEIVNDYIEQTAPVAIPIFNLGFKEKPRDISNEKDVACSDILMYMIASDSSKMYRDLLDSELINTDFSYEIFEGESFCSIIFSSESRKPKKAAETIKAYINSYKQNGLDKDDFELSKKALYGKNISILNSVSTIANTLVDEYFAGRDIYKYLDAIANVTFEDVSNCLSRMFDMDKCVLSVVKGQEN